MGNGVPCGSTIPYSLFPIPHFLCGDRREPVAVLVRLAGDAVEERLLQLFRDRAALAAADRAVVELADRRYLRGGAGEESLVGAVHLVAGDALGNEGDAEILRDADHRVARDALEGGGELGLVERAVLHQEDVLAGALRDEAVHVEQERLVVAVLRDLVVREDRVHVGADRLRAAHRDVDVVAHVGRGLDANAALDRVGAEIGPPGPRRDRDVDADALRGDAHRLGAVEGDRPDVARVELVRPHDFLLRLDQRLLVVGDLHAVDMRRAEQPVGVLAQPEDRGAVRRLVGAHALEHAHAVVQCMREHVGGRVAPGHELAVVPDVPVAIGHRRHSDAPRKIVILAACPTGVRRCRPLRSCWWQFGRTSRMAFPITRSLPVVTGESLMAGDIGGWLRMLRQRVITDQDSERDRLHKTLAIFACGLMGFSAMLWLAIYQLMGIRFSATVPLTYLAVSAGSLAFYLWNRNFPLFRFIQTSLFLFVPFIMQWSIGSYVSSSGVMLWALLAPVGVMIFQGPRQSIPWFFAYIVMTAVSGFFDYYLGEGTQQGVNMQTIAVFFALNFAAMSSIIYLLISYFVRQRDKLQENLDVQHKLLQAEQGKSERLLLNILPGPIANRLKEQQITIADGFADVTVMFADIINFTQLSEEMPPKFMVTLLNDGFPHFDQPAEQHGIEKIKTIGDAYMVAGGLDIHHRDDHATAPERDYSAAVCELALDMRDYMAALSGVRISRLQIHVGIGTGPVVAGVIGTKKFIYDLWGDTVNIASRVTFAATAGKILLDATTYRRVRDRFEFEGPLVLNVKGKGEIQAWRLVGRKGASESVTRNA